MGIMELIGKIKGVINKDKEKHERPNRISNEEFELNIYQEKERQERIKRQVDAYRRRDTKNMFEDHITNQPPTLLKQKSIMKHDSHILKQGGKGLW
jgi:hypothetical protein